MWTRFKDILSRPVDAASLAVFRICFGVVMFLEAMSLVRPLADQSLVERFYTGEHVQWLFRFPGFQWVRPWPEPFMTLHCYALALGGLLLALGLYPRLAAAGVFLTWTYLWLLDQTLFHDPYYLMSLFAFLLMWMPSGRSLSLDRYWKPQDRGRKDTPAGGAGEIVPYWTVFLLRIQLFVVYFFGGVAKLSTEWVEHAEPLRTWLARPVASEAISAYLPGFLAEAMQGAAFAFFISRAGLVFDLLAGFLLWIPRTRLLAFVLAVAFHAFHHFIPFDDVGWFPLLGVTATTIFFEPDWPRRLWRRLETRSFPAPDVPWLIAGVVLLPIIALPMASKMPLGASWPFLLLAAFVGTTLGWSSTTATERIRSQPQRLPPWAFACIVAWVAVQFLLPLRHFLIPGDVNWTSEGERFAWRMNACQKDVMPLYVRLEDAVILPRDAGRRRPPDWQAWAGGKVLYQQVNVFQLDWKSMPEFVVVFEPFHGERVLFNPLAGSLGENPTLQQATDRVNGLWQKQYGRVPQLVVTKSRAEVFDEIDELLRDKSSIGELRNSALQARKLADVVPKAIKNRAPEGPLMLLAFRQHLKNLAYDPQYGEAIRQILRQGPPLLSHGAPAIDARFVEIYDDALMVRSDDGFVTLDRTQWKDAWPLSYVVFFDLGAYTDVQRSALPLSFIHRELDGTYYIRWNPAAELRPHQEQLMKSQPLLCRQYARHVADRWEEIYQRRPAVYFDNKVAMAPYGFQPNIDPEIDLASVPLNVFGHNSWILPLDRSVARDANDPFARRTAGAN